MRRHDTPEAIAERLAQSVPSTFTTILDPSVGNGALVRPFLDRVSSSCLTVVGVDTDAMALANVEKKFRPVLGKRLHLFNEDFIQCDIRKQNVISPEGFDCVVMNPPFQGRKWVQLSSVDTDYKFPDRPVRIEAAFLIKAIDLLKPSGYLLSVLPSSIISSQTGDWLRYHLLSCGAIQSVHELPPYSFPGIEAKVYLLVFQKEGHQPPVQLLNHDLHHPHVLPIPINDLETTNRLDYGYYAIAKQLSQMRSGSGLQWCQIRDEAKVVRGNIVTPKGVGDALHSCDYHNGFWYSSRLTTSMTVSPNMSSDKLIMARVGRNTLSTIGLISGPSAPTTDCILEIRPKYSDRSLKILFGIRSMLQIPGVIQLLERGSGAKYITTNDLECFYIPSNLSSSTTKLKKIFEKYSNAVCVRDFQTMLLCEKDAGQCIIEITNRSSFA